MTESKVRALPWPGRGIALPVVVRAKILSLLLQTTEHSQYCHPKLCTEEKSAETRTLTYAS